MGDLPNRRLEEVLEDTYGLLVTQMSWHDSLYLKRVAAKVETSSGLLKLKRYTGSEQALRQYYRRYLALARTGFKGLPRWYRTAEGKPYVAVQDELFYLIDWIEGRPFRLSSTDARRLGEALAEMHRVRPDTAGFRKPRWRDQLRQVTQARRLLRGGIAERLPKDARRFIEQQESLLDETFRHVADSLTVRHRLLKSGVVHGDVTLPNILFVDHRARFIDWERLNVGFPLEELAKAAMNTCHFSILHVEHLLTGYDYDLLDHDQKEIFSTFFEIPREVVYLLLRASRGHSTKHDASMWTFVRDTWDARMALIRHFAAR
ncbi:MULTISPECIES: aminoglycoside phosphotransferase family protein [Alicyclobacillus]|uniref:Aminoglycoside phosphotransferase family protein n=1 Tax=Alicyclobacillus acidoterrestris (strain ATCC 49025 / DSM 3922 / CIP 106132 / NCIMB 13137 / GD3B) TaxID=1356854 RepID=T0C5K6_ALIAG|nr:MULTISPECIES: aminoglycoside phosphotransferase family protein [Alicyclobacillus]EPZ48264.1 hypothetical protein N007_00665 [Alicyclobacillus acidoterrestris ATCC 49025]UNO50417.1 aminoglycoside phosphotransferase family protein [Alicyclobacillus acidoterrestris]